jgi:hypothetical protein
LHSGETGMNEREETKSQLTQTVISRPLETKYSSVSTASYCVQTCIIHVDIWRKSQLKNMSTEVLLTLQCRSWSWSKWCHGVKQSDIDVQVQVIGDEP